MSHTVWTIGHSTRSFDEFTNLLQIYGIKAIADVRSFPGSRKYPHFGQELLAKALHERGFEYEWFRALGGRRRARTDSPNTVWRNMSFRGYADYMETPAFHTAVKELMKRTIHAHTALMCAEAVWWRCHRSIIADYLCVQGIEVVHILDDHHSKRHPMTTPARIMDGRLTYMQADN